jgi:hypothetical protein
VNFELRIHLTEREARRLARPIRGQGGWQNLLRHWQCHYSWGSVVLNDPVWIERSFRYAKGRGGFQGRIGGPREK